LPLITVDAAVREDAAFPLHPTISQESSVPNLMVIVASTRQARIGHTVANWAIDTAKGRADLTVDVADLQEIGLPFFDEAHPPMMGKYELPHTLAWAERV